MPFVTVRVFKGSLTDEQKAKIQKRDHRCDDRGKRAMARRNSVRTFGWPLRKSKTRTGPSAGVPGSLELLNAFVKS